MTAELMEIGMSERNTDRDWAAIARENPYWGVLSVSEFMGAELGDDTKAKFFASGEDYVADLLRKITLHLDPAFVSRRVLDFGCGVGRLLLPLAQRAERAVGVDVAPAMLELSRLNAEVLGLKNAEFVLGDDQLSRVVGEFDLVNTYIVLQHIPPARGYVLLRRLFDLIAPGGVGSFQLTYGKARRFMEHEAPRAFYYRREGGSLVDLVPTLDQAPEGSIMMFDYDLNQIFALAQTVSSGPMLATPTNDDDHLGLHLIFRKASV